MITLSEFYQIEHNVMKPFLTEDEMTELSVQRYNEAIDMLYVWIPFEKFFAKKRHIKLEMNDKKEPTIKRK